jgi:hypothetical protein
MEINFVDSAGNPIPNLNFHLEDSYEIYFNPITFKYSKDLTADANGYLKLSDMEFGDYKLTSKSGTIATTSPYQPIGLKSGADLKVRVTMTGSPTQPTILSSSPLTGKIGDNVSLTINGSNFDNLASVKMVNTSGQEIAGANVVVTKGQTLEADFNLQGATVGFFDIIITNPLGESVRQVGGFEVKNE